MSLQRPPKVGKGVYSTGGSKGGPSQVVKRSRRSLYVKIFFGLKRQESPVYMDISINVCCGRLIIKLFRDIVPNLRKFSGSMHRGEGPGVGGCPLNYQGTYFHNVRPGFVCQGGVVTGTGIGGPSICSFFEDENHNISHSERGILSMVNKGPNTNDHSFS